MGWTHFKIKTVLFYFIVKSHRKNAPNKSRSYGTFHQDMVGTVYWDFLGPCQSLSLAVLEREEEGREVVLARAELVFTTAQPRGGKAGGEQA